MNWEIDKIMVIMVSSIDLFISTMNRNNIEDRSRKTLFHTTGDVNLSFFFLSLMFCCSCIFFPLFSLMQIASKRIYYSSSTCMFSFLFSFFSVLLWWKLKQYTKKIEKKYLKNLLIHLFCFCCILCLSFSFFFLLFVVTKCIFKKKLIVL